MRMNHHLEFKKIGSLPRIPRNGNLDITYRCNNDCRHCWVSIPAGSLERQKELSLDQIIKIVDEAREMGCSKWLMSGGEPMLRPDFPEAFEYITRKSTSYSLNTNGTLITPSIARLLKRRGDKMVALYGATTDVHDHITRNPGSFEAVMRGFAYLREAGAGFVVQVIPMRDNYHQLREMIRLAESLSPHWRIGAAWLYFSAYGDPAKNEEIARQRLEPGEVVELESPDLSHEEGIETGFDDRCASFAQNGGLLDSCILTGNDFHIDPYGQMTFCSFVKDPGLRYDLMKGSFEAGWEEFIPSLAGKVRATEEYPENCGVCSLRDDCRWCPVYSYLEQGKYQARVAYLCDVGEENRRYKKRWLEEHRRYFQVAGITIQVDSDIAFQENTFHPKFKIFETEGPGEDTVLIRHHFGFPDSETLDLGEVIYHKEPWAIYRKGGVWTYVLFNKSTEEIVKGRIAVFNNEHTRAEIYSPNESQFRRGGLYSLSLLPTDQYLLSHILAHRDGCYLHSSGVIFEGKGFLFVGHSEAGKSTMVKLLKDGAEILCDDRMILRRWPEGFKIHGTWSHGEIEEVSPNSAPLRAVLFLEKVQEAPSILPMEDKGEVTRRLLACMIKPFVSPQWWEAMLNLVEKMVREISFYRLRSDKSERVVELLKTL